MTILDWPGLPARSRRMIALGAAVLAMVLAIVAGLGWQMRRDALAAAGRDAARLSAAIAGQASRSLQDIESTLSALGGGAVAQGGASNALWRRQAGAALDAARGTAEGGHGVPAGILGVTVFGPSGDIVAEAGTPLALDERAEVRAAVAALPARALLRLTGGGLHLAVPVTGPDGTPRGAASALLSPGALMQACGGLPDMGDRLDVGGPLGKGGLSAALIHLDGTVLARCGEDGPLQAARPAAAPGAAERRITSVSPVPRFPLLAEAGMVADALAPWRRLATAAAACILAAGFCVALLLGALLRQFRRVAASEASLAERNAALEATRRDMEAQAAALQASQDRLAEKSAALETTLGHMDQGIIMVDADLQVVVSNGRVRQMLNLPDELMDRKPLFQELVAHQIAIGEFHMPGALDAAQFDWSRIVTEQTSYERVRPCGRVMEVCSIPLARGGMVRTYTDITERRRSEEQVRHLAHHDGLTQLANRTTFLQALDRAIVTQDMLRRAARRADDAPQGVAVLYLDLDGFKQVNDTHGHGAGDALLVEVARRLHGAVRTGDTVARMGGDEFAVIQLLGPAARPLPAVPDAAAPDAADLDTADLDTAAAGQGDGCGAGPDWPEALARRIIEAMAEPFAIGGLHCRIGMSVGIAAYPAHAAAAGDLLRCADSALYQAKSSGKGAFRVFDPAADNLRQQQRSLEQELRGAVPGGQLFLEYQPIVDAATLQVRRCEALVRWRHPVRGLVGPAEFIGLAEESGLIVPIGLWVLQAACAAAAAWPSAVRLAVNLSPVQLTRPGFPDDVAAVLRRTGLHPGRLSLEVTEGVLLERTPDAVEAMEALRTMGVGFSLDDFGTAHAGLAYLQHFPFDAVKIDRSFVQDAAARPGARAILAAMLAIGEAFGLTVVAEGIETEAQLALVRAMGCAEAQGYLTGRPMSARRLQALLEGAAPPGSAVPPRALAARAASGD